MAYTLDTELVPVMAALAARAATAPAPARGDWKALREQANAGLATLVPPTSRVQKSTHVATAPDGAAIELRWYTTHNPSPGSAVLYVHGGGLVGGSLDLYDEVLSWYVAQTGVPFLAVAYRLAPEATGTMWAYLDVGDLDIFRDETITYARSLARAGVPIELHLHPGVPHGWERFAPNSRAARRALSARQIAEKLRRRDTHGERRHSAPDELAPRDLHGFILVIPGALAHPFFGVPGSGGLRWHPKKGALR